MLGPQIRVRGSLALVLDLSLFLTRQRPTLSIRTWSVHKSIVRPRAAKILDGYNIDRIPFCTKTMC